MLSGKLLPIHLKPQRDELLSSWLTRLSIAHGQTLYSFCTLVLQGGRDTWELFLIADVDRTAKMSTLALLSDITATPIDRVIATTINAYEEALYEKNLSARRRPWILPFALSTGVKTRTCLQFCPQCLSEDTYSYFRRSWRLAFNVLCEKHQIQLFDKCPTCGEAIVLSRSLKIDANTPLLNPNTHCHFCRSDLRDTKPDQYVRVFSEEEVQYQKLLINAVEKGWIEIPASGPIYSHLYFVVLHRLARMISQRRRGAFLQTRLSRMAGVQISDTVYRSKAKELEYLNISERRALISMVGWLLTDWPERFIAFCRDNKLLSWELTYTLDPIPFWYWSIVHSHLTKRHLAKRWNQPSDEEIGSAITYMREHCSPIKPHRYDGEMKVVSEFLAQITTYRRKKLWKIYGSPNPRNKSNRINAGVAVTTSLKVKATSFPKPRYIPDALWEEVRPHLPYVSRLKRSPDDRTVLNGTLYVLSTNCTWDTIPSEFGTWQQVYKRYQKWKRLGDFDHIWSLCKHLYS